MPKAVSDFITEVKYPVDDPNQTRYSVAEYGTAITDAVRALMERAEIVNVKFLQYGMGETKDVDRAVMEEKEIGNKATYGDSGTAEVATDNPTTTLFDDDKQWVEDEWTGYTLVLTVGPGAGETFTITSNTASVLTINGTWVVTPTVATQYDIRHPATNILYNNLLTTSQEWPEGVWGGGYVRITAGTAIGQERKITEMAGQEMIVEYAWNPGLASGDTYEIVAVKTDYALPLDFYRLTKVKVDGVEIKRKDISSPVDPNVDPGYSLHSNMTTPQMRVENLGGGEMIEVFYIPEMGLLTSTTQQVPMGDIFFRDIQYYTILRLKGNNYEQLRMDAQFMKGADEAMVKFMTDINVKSNMEVTSHYEEWSD